MNQPKALTTPKTAVSRNLLKLGKEAGFWVSNKFINDIFKAMGLPGFSATTLGELRAKLDIGRDVAVAAPKPPAPTKPTKQPAIITKINEGTPLTQNEKKVVSGLLTLLAQAQA